MKHPFTISLSIIFLIFVRKLTNEVITDADFRVSTLCGTGVKQNLTEPVKWYLKAAEQGHDGAHLLVLSSKREGCSPK